MTTFCCNKKVIPELTLVIASFSGLSTPLASDEALEEVIVSGVKDPRSGSLISSGSSRLVSPTDLVAPAFSTGELVARLAGVANNGQGGLFQSYSMRGFSRSQISAVQCLNFCLHSRCLLRVASSSSCVMALQASPATSPRDGQEAVGTSSFA